MFKLTELQHRRQQLVSHIKSDELIVLMSAPEHIRNGDVFYPYRQNSDFYYLTAFPEPETIALLIPDRKGSKFILFNRAEDPGAAIWNGERIGQTRAKKEYGADEAYTIEQLETKLPEYLANTRVCYYLGDATPNNPMLVRINKILERLKKPPLEYTKKLVESVHEMRLRKSPTELDCLRKAAHMSGEGHLRAMRACRPGLYEYQLEAELMYAFYGQGSQALAYPNIVASGANACILHYTDNRAELKKGDLVLIDAGCEYQNYASDITRTFPVNGRFSPEQKAIYQIVLKAQQAILALIKPGVAWNQLQKTCVELITQGLVDVGILKGKLGDLIQHQSYQKFYMHGCSHWLGLDVHDVGCYKIEKKWRSLEPDMVFTVEPGIYISPAADIDKKWWNIGIRIEDDVRVTQEACEILTSQTPKDLTDIENIMRTSS
ncbi:aminopeptidase P N-terminal domain-containing protein [Rickettsiella endosymbiont of Aleochara curtula]|uniref:aminopeptidase P N-terminal domain-containing protein n=1 Tax=Rickettsiella endosymbiont of Aleochara curtula TaxID=3077936 RepID=UPI00313F02EE